MANVYIVTTINARARAPTILTEEESALTSFFLSGLTFKKQNSIRQPLFDNNNDDDDETY